MLYVIALLVIVSVASIGYALLHATPAYLTILPTLLTILAIVIELRFVKPAREARKERAVKALSRDIIEVLREIRDQRASGRGGAMLPMLWELQLLIRDRRYEAAFGKGAFGTDRDKAPYMPDMRLLKFLVDHFLKTKDVAMIEQGYKQNKRYKLGERWETAIA